MRTQTTAPKTATLRDLRMILEQERRTSPLESTLIRVGLLRDAYDALAGGETKSWRCFHCDEHFVEEAEAREHFGPTQLSAPACQVSAAELRAMEQQLTAYHAEDTEQDRRIATILADHRTALVAEEEKGYARGLAAAGVRAACAQDQQDADRWRGLFGCDRVRVLGTGGTNHIGVEFWIDHPDPTAAASTGASRVTLTEFADRAAARTSSPTTEEVRHG